MSEDKKKQRWLQMGVELEGSWIKPRKTVAALVRGAKAHDDRSVHIGHGDPGEIVTRPHDNMFGLLEDITTLWPDTVDVSCGFHIHASFTPMDGSVLASDEFYSYFKKEWAAWGKAVGLPRTHEFWVRLRGDNKFAKDRFEPSAQLSGADSGRGGEARYTILNWHAWKKHGTLECRLLPMFADKDTAISAVTKLADIYDNYLNSHEFESVVIESNTLVVGDEVVEVYHSVTPDTTPTVKEWEGKHAPVIAADDVYYAIDGAMNLMLPYKKDTGTVVP